MENLNSIQNYNRYLIIDVETNGIGTFRPPTQTPIQISYQLINQHGELIKKNSQFISGVEEINWSEEKIGKCPWSVKYINNHGISIEEFVQQLKSCLNEHTIIVGHNIEFDINIIVRHSGHQELLEYPTLCTMKTTTKVCKLPSFGYRTYKFPKLCELARELRIEVNSDNFHDSVYDVEITKRCLLKLLTDKHYRIGVVK